MSITLIAVALFLIFVFPTLVDLVVDALPVSNKQAALECSCDPSCDVGCEGCIDPMDYDCPF
jgi:hypothetical protein